MADFRFEDMEIWKEAMIVSDTLLNLADKAEDQKFFRFAEQLRAATMSISNNIPEGSGSSSDKDFASFLNISPRPVFECANIVFLFERRNIMSAEQRKSIFINLVVLSKKIARFRKSLI
jgi:four helix bundle protein